MASVSPFFSDCVLSQILHFADAPTKAVVALGSRKCEAVARLSLYRAVNIDDPQTAGFLQTVAAKPELGHWVRSLVLRGKRSRSRPLGGRDFTATMKSLVNLRTLHLEYEVDFDCLVDTFPGKLIEFFYWPQVRNGILWFCLEQPTIESVYFRDLNVSGCKPEFLPALKCVYAHPYDVAFLVTGRAVKEVHILPGRGDYEARPAIPLDCIAMSTARVVLLEVQMSGLLSAAEEADHLIDLLPWVRQLIVHQDATWGTEQIPVDNFKEEVERLIDCITDIFTLRHLVFVLTYGIEQAQIIREVVVNYYGRQKRKYRDYVPSLKKLEIYGQEEARLFVEGITIICCSAGRCGSAIHDRPADLPFSRPLAMKRKIQRMQATIVSDSDSEGEAAPVHREEPLFHRSYRTGEDGFTHATTLQVHVPASPSKRRPAERDRLEPDFSAVNNSNGAPDSSFPFAGEDSFAFDEGHPVDPQPRKGRESDHPMAQWVAHRRERFLDELLRLEGRHDHRLQTKCANCPRKAAEAVYRCKDCFTDALFCKACLVSIHRDNPLHRVEIWEESAVFEWTSLKSLGLRIQLGHGRNGTCPGTAAKRAAAAKASAAVLEPVADAPDPEELFGDAPQPKEKGPRDDFCIVDSNGIHEVGLDFCCCALAQEHDVQLLRARLYPATITNPATAATFRVLRDFHLLSLEAKSSAHHFYNKLARQTNNNGVFQPRTRYTEFRRMTRQWRNLQMYKRAGRGHAVDGIQGTKAGECALLCPACPQPGKNLPPDGSWKSVPPERRFLYALFLALDANFRMKRKDVSSEEEDPSLGDGVAFFAQVDGYMAHLDKHWELEQEKSTCVAHDAVDEPDRDAYGTAASGIGTVDCARHNMKRPNGVGDLQKGERYINMDYMLWKSLENHDDIIQLFVSYDIVCQWHKNVWMRLAQYSPRLQERAGGGREFVWLIPKFHLPAHIEACNILFSFNLTPYVAQTDGEAPERGWANANPLASSTKEMGPGARQDALDDHFNDWNHKKIVGLGKYLLERTKKAVDGMTTHRLELLETEQGLEQESLKKWKRAMELWELDSKNPNPFALMEKQEGVFTIRERLAAEASEARAGDEADDIRGDLHAYEMIEMGMQLEDQQRELAFDAGAVKLHATDRQRTTLLERSNKLARKITEWLKIRESFTPLVATLRTADDQARSAASRLQPTPALPVHAVKLWLPSRLASMAAVTVKKSHARLEFQMRIGQADAALEELRRMLLVRTAKYQYKDDFTRGVAANTRAKTSIQGLDERIRRKAAQYRAARLALVSLGSRLHETEWKVRLRVLTPDDVRQRPRVTFSDPQHKARKKKKKRLEGARATEEQRKKKAEEREASWIWLAQLSEGEGLQRGMVEALRIEWAKTRARAWRWTEEVDLLEQEMHRVLEFLKWRAGWWIALKDQRPSVMVDEILQEGFTAYARRQSDIQRNLAKRFAGNWQDLPGYIACAREGLDTVPAEVEGAKGDDDEEEEEEDAEAPIPENGMDPCVMASLVEESLA
ncbi:hypothetical protein K438DRAFT_1992419 [Mycena galopus ATCC 62051]|nr:hypothetical protein K438DRAFT_1992419 [Mycena galopus ATCC 62051]